MATTEAEAAGRLFVLGHERWARERLTRGLVVATVLILLPAVMAAQHRTRLRVGTSGDYPPFSSAGAGFDIDVATELAAHLGLEIEWVPFRWPDLTDAVRRGDFDIAMSGVTWRPARAVLGRMSRAVAQGGPCVVAAKEADLAAPKRIAVNRGGILERFARQKYPPSAIETVDDNLSLPNLLAGGEVEAFLTDSFEVRHFGRDWPVSCEPPRDRKVYWVTPEAEAWLAAAVDAWLTDNEARLRELRQEHFGDPQPRQRVDHLVDLLHRRLAFMPEVAAAKEQRRLPVEDLAQEARVLAAVSDKARVHGLDDSSLVAFFETQIELAKAIQRRQTGREAVLGLESEIRPALRRLGDAIVAELAALAPLSESQLGNRLELLADLLEPAEIDRLREAAVQVERRRAAAALSCSLPGLTSPGPGWARERLLRAPAPLLDSFERPCAASRPLSSFLTGGPAGGI